MKSTILSLALIAALSAPALASKVVNVAGAGRVQVAPNIARVTITITDAAKLGVAIPTLVEQNNTRVAPTLDFVKQVVGKQGTVTAIPQISQTTKYDNKTNENVKTGHQITTRIEVELRGKAAIEQKLGKLFDSKSIQADNVSNPTLDLSEKSREAAENRAARKAVTNARSKAEARLEKGETLGEAIERGDRVEVSSPRRGVARAAAMSLEMASDSPSHGQAIVETGKITVQAFVNFVYEVLGLPQRLKEPKKPGFVEEGPHPLPGNGPQSPREGGI